jgi:hypothetical protein
LTDDVTPTGTAWRCSWPNHVRILVFGRPDVSLPGVVVTMPLSPHEQRVLAEMEASLLTDTAKYAVPASGDVRRRRSLVAGTAVALAAMMLMATLAVMAVVPAAVAICLGVILLIAPAPLIVLGRRGH